MSLDARFRAVRPAAVTVLLAAAAVTVGGCTSALNSEPAFSARQTRTYTHAISRIDIWVDAGSITLSPSSGKAVKVTRHLQWSSKKPHLRQGWTGAILHLTSSCPGQRQCEVSYTIAVPASVAVHAHTSAGNVTIRGLRGGASITDAAGNVRLTGVGGKIRVSSQAGAITGTSLRSASVSVRGLAGAIALRFAAVPGTVTATTQAGQVLVAVPAGGKPDYRFVAQTQAGQRRVSVSVNSRSAHSITARTTAGNVIVR
jgi:hypothetical protein